MKIIIELDMHELAFLMAQKTKDKKLDESTQSDLREELEEEILEDCPLFAKCGRGTALSRKNLLALSCERHERHTAFLR